MYCQKCGKQLPNDARFCEFCGAPVPQKTNTHREPPATTNEVDPPDFGNVSWEPNIKRHFNVIVGIVLALALLSVVYFALSSRFSQPEVSSPTTKPSQPEVSSPTTKPSQTEVSSQAKVSNLTAKPSPVVALAIGDSYQGGKIAYLLASGDPGYDANVQHGLIVAPSDQSTGIPWALTAYESISVPGTLTTLGSGAANTDKIIDQNGAGTTYAAGLARAYTGGGYTDWYLPSNDELSQLYLNEGAVGGFAGAYYWSSSEYGTIAAWTQAFTNGTQGPNYKTNTIYVRAVRSF